MQHVFWKQYDICGSLGSLIVSISFLTSEGEKKSKEESWMRRVVRLENYERIAVKMIGYKYTRISGATL